jgi:hypothetical protein
VVAGSLSTFSLVGLVEAVAHVTVPASLANSVLQVELTGLDVELSTCTLPIIFNQQTFAPGFMFSVQVNRLLRVPLGLTFALASCSPSRLVLINMNE